MLSLIVVSSNDSRIQSHRATFLLHLVSFLTVSGQKVACGLDTGGVRAALWRKAVDGGSITVDAVEEHLAAASDHRCGSVAWDVAHVYTAASSSNTAVKRFFRILERPQLKNKTAADRLPRDETIISLYRGADRCTKKIPGFHVVVHPTASCVGTCGIPVSCCAG